MYSRKKFKKLIEISLALKNSHQFLRCFHVTFAINKGRIISIGINHYKTHPRSLFLPYQGKDGADLRNQVGLHSELACWGKLGYEDCSSLTFVNVRIDNNGQANYAKPCNGCSVLFKQINAKKVFYSNRDGGFEKFFLDEYGYL